MIGNMFSEGIRSDRKCLLPRCQRLLERNHRHTAYPTAMQTGVAVNHYRDPQANHVRRQYKGFPYIAYPDACDSCFLCCVDCPREAVEVSAEIKLPFI